jgi:hypothetical protein
MADDDQARRIPADDDDTARPSPDDALEPDSDKDGLYRPAEDEEKLEGDYNRPAAPADDVPTKPVPPDDPDTDTDMDPHEVYDEGEADTAHDNRDEENPSDRPRPLEPEK